MEKFLSIPVLDAGGTDNQEQLVSIIGVKGVQSFTGRADLTYLGGHEVRLIWPAAAPTAEEIGVEVQNDIVKALEKGWTQVSTDFLPSGAIKATDGTVTNPLDVISWA